MNLLGKVWLSRRHRAVRSRCKPEPVCLDLGCGDQPIYASAIHVDRQLSKAVDVIADVEALPFASDAIDQIFCLEVVEHLEKPELFVVEAYRTLKQGGKLILTTPSNSVIWRVVWFAWSRTLGKDWLGKHIDKFHIEQVKTYFRRMKVSRCNLFLQLIEATK